MLRNFIRKKGIYIAIITTVCGLICIPVLIWFASVIIIDLGTVLVLLLGCGLLGLILWKYVQEDIDLEYYQFAMFAFAGFGMCLLNLILFLNFTVRIQSYSKSYVISRKGVYNQILHKGNADFSALERNLDKYFKESSNCGTSFPAKKVTITFDKGLFGFDMIHECTFN